MRRLVPLLFAASACELPPPPESTPRLVDLKIVSVNPTSVFIEGNDEVTLRTENGCDAADATITVGGQPVARIASPERDTLVFTAPPHETDGCSGPAYVKLELACAKPADPATAYGRNRADTPLTYDAATEPAPTLMSFAPAGGPFPGDVIAVTARFTRVVDAASITAESFGITGVTGAIAAEADGRTFTFTPAEPLAPAGTYVAFATTAIRSERCAKALRPTIAPEGASIATDRDSWTFTTFPATWIRPQITDKAPAPDTTVGTDASCSATFDQDMDATSFEGAFWLGDATEAPVAGTVSWDAETRTATYEPAAPLAPGDFTCLVRGTSLLAPELDGPVARTAAGAWLRETASWGFRVAAP